MPGFGRFESVDELASSGPFTVFSARLAGQDGPPTFAAKTFRVQDDLADPEVLEARAGSFLDGAKLQQSLAKAPEAGWAPVHEMGRTEQYAYYVTDLFPLTGQRLIDLRRELTANEIAHIISEVARSLAAIRKAGGGRGHGDLKPSNVMLRVKEDESLEEATVLLADPLPDSRVDSGAQAQDQRELADLLHQLITFRASPKGGALQRGPEWSRLGPAGEELRKVCEWLLNPAPGTALPTPEEIQSRLVGAATTSSGGSKKGLLIGIAAAVLLLGGGGAAYMLLKPAPPPPPPPPPPPIVDNTEGDTPVVVKVTEKDPRKEKLWTDWSKTATELPQIAAPILAMLDDEGEAGKPSADEIRAALTDIAAKMAEIEAAAWEEVPDTTAPPDQPRNRPVTKEERQAVAKSIEQFTEQVIATRTKLAPAGNGSLDRLELMVKDAAKKVADGVEGSKPNAAVSEAAVKLINKLKPPSDLRFVKAKVVEIPPAWGKARQGIEATSRWATDLEAALPVDPKLDTPQSSAATTAPAAALYAAERTKALEALAANVAGRSEVPAPDDTEYLAARDASVKLLSDLAAEANSLVAQAVAIESMLSRGYALGEKGPSQVSIAEIRQKVRASPRFDALKECVAPVLARVDALEAVDRVADAAGLLQQIEQGDADVSRVSMLMAAWNRLPQVKFPTDVAQLAKGATLLTEKVKPALGKVPDQGRRDAMIKQAEGSLTQMWFTLAGSGQVTAPADVDQLFRAMETMGVKPADLARVGPWASFNYARWKLTPALKAVADGKAEEQVAALQPILVNFWKTPEAAALLSNPVVAKMREDLKKIEEGKKPLDFTQEGPGRVGWTPSADESGAKVTYTSSGLSFTFLRVSDPDAEMGAYVGTNEVSASQFAQLVTAGGLWAEVEGFLPSKGVDVRPGPRVWSWNPAGDGIIAAPAEKDSGNGWLAPDPGMTLPYYPANMPEPGPPTLDMPMNYLGPHAAVIAARVLNCRLPTTAEWAAASVGGVADANLRDASWVAEHAYIMSINGKGPGQAQGKAKLPNGGIFRPQQVQAEQDNAAAPSANDNVLWFRPVGTGDTFRDVVGNVAEWVFDDANALMGMPTKVTKADVNKVFSSTAPVFVVGGSALSPDVPREPVKPESVLRTRKGYSDVGFRLAFTTGGGSGGGAPKARALKVLVEAPYLGKPN